MRREIISPKLFDDIGFPLSVRRPKPRPGTDPHCHEFQELVVVLSGHGRHITEGESYPIRAGDVFLIGVKQIHAYSDDVEMEYVNILFDLQRLMLPLADLRDLPGYHALFDLEPKLRKTHKFRSRLMLQVEDLTTLSVLISQLEEELSSRRPGYRFLACARLMIIIGHLSRCYTRVPSLQVRLLMQMSEMLTFLEKHSNEAITLGRLAQLGHMSTSTVVRVFRKTVGHSPIDHLVRIRVAKASELLQYSDDRVTDVAMQCGFSDSNYFSRQFRRIAGVSPRQFRASFRPTFGGLAHNFAMSGSPPTAPRGINMMYAAYR